MIYYVTIFFICLILRRLPTLNNRTDFDSYGHLYFISELKRQGRSPWGKIKIRCFEGEVYSHPFLLHCILSFIPEKILIKYQVFINIIFDSIFCVLIFATAEILFKNKNLALMSLFLYFFTPMWFSKISMGPRINSFTPRLFTEILFNLLICVIVGVYNLNKIEFYLFAILLTIAILLTSKFGLQMILFSLPLISVFLKDYNILFVFILSIIIILLVSRRKAYFLLKRQIVHLIQYYKVNKSNKSSLTDRNKFLKINKKEIFSFAGAKKIIYNYLFYNSHTAILFKMPIFLIIVVSFFYSFNLQNEYYKMLIIILSTFLIYVIVSIRSFLFLGEAERYLNHISILIIFYSVEFLYKMQLLWVGYFLIIYGILFWIIELLTFNYFTNTKKRDFADKEVQEILSNLQSPQVVLSFPYHNFCVFRIMLNTKHFTIYPCHMDDKIRSKFMEKFEYKYPYLDLKKLSEINKFTNCSCLIIDVDSLTQENFSNSLNLFEWQEVKLKQSVYRLFLKNIN
jgi:hypothetical protein